MAARRTRLPPLRALTAGLVMAVTVNAVEAVAVVTAMPAVSKELHGDRLYGLAFSAYMLANLSAIVATGRQADRHGPARPFAMGASAFAVGLVLAGAAPTMGVIVLARAVQGFGGGAMATVAFVAVGRGFAAHEHARVFAYMSTAWVLPGLLAPVVAGFVAEHFSWRWVFVGVLPFVILALVLTLPALRALGKPPPTPRRSIRVVAPGLAPAIITRFCINYGFFGTDTFVPLAVTRLHKASTVIAGLTITGATLTWTIGSWVHSRRSQTVSPRRIIGTGVVLLTLGVALTASVANSAVPLWAVACFWSVGGLGMGLAFTAISVYALRHASPGREGHASAQLQIADMAGSAIAGGVAGAIIGLGGQTHLPAALVAAFAIAAVVTGLGFLATRRLNA
jgi:MFS family permease